MLNKLFICFLIYCFIGTSWTSQLQDHRDVGEFTGGEYFYRDQIQPTVPIISEGFMPSNSMGHSAFGEPLSEVYSDWPERIDNQGIFSYLLEERVSDSFCAFIQSTYKTSCAVMYYTDDRGPLVIGSGGYIHGGWVQLDEGVVATARHNFQGKDITQLYVRFYSYNVKRTSDPEWLHIEENYIDVPVIGAMTATNGFDAGILRLRTIPENLRHNYTKMIFPTTNGYGDGFATMPEGKYALFHFAGGHHLISVGHIYAPPAGSWINSNIGIEGGDGASGSMFLQENLGRLDAHGISIYRHVDDCGVGRRPERRAIPFARFGEKTTTITDRISAPYANNPNFMVLVTPTLASDGYEFLRWRDHTHIGRRQGGAFKHPDHPMYYLDDPDNMSNHHIVPIDHLIYLWEYIHDSRLDEKTASTIRNSVNINEIRANFSKTHSTDAQLAFTDRAYKAECDQAVERLYEQAIDARYQEEAGKRYGHLKLLINILTPENIQDKTWFAWSWWNLFKGPNSREDDPTNDSTGDFSEKHGPLSFEHGKAELWSVVKTLDKSIKELKKVSQPSFSVASILKAEKDIKTSLERLGDVWQRQIQQIHPYNSDEWLFIRKMSGGQFTDKEGRKIRKERKNVYRGTVTELKKSET